MLFDLEQGPPSQDKADRTRLTASSLSRLPQVTTKKWKDTEGNDYRFSIHPASSIDIKSDAADTCDSLLGINANVCALFDLIQRACRPDMIATSTAPYAASEKAILKELLETVQTLWKNVRLQSAIKTELRARLHGTSQALKREKMAITAMMFLCRIHNGASTFILAAESMPMFRNIEYIAVKVPQLQSPKLRQQDTPLATAERLEIKVTRSDWLEHLKNRKTISDFVALKKQTQHTHAEIQALHYYDSILAQTSKAHVVHPYIGCSKRCCLLCYWFIRSHGVYHTRGTHETVMHRWGVPVVSSNNSAANYDKFESASRLLLATALAIIQHLVDREHSCRNKELQAQSSAGLSTVQTVCDRILGQTEKAAISIRQAESYAF